MCSNEASETFGTQLLEGLEARCDTLVVDVVITILEPCSCVFWTADLHDDSSTFFEADRQTD